jgi:hypothetical protein
VQDLHFFVTGGDDENELILSSVLQGFFDAVTLLLRYLWLYFVILYPNLKSSGYLLIFVFLLQEQC